MGYWKESSQSEGMGCTLRDWTLFQQTTINWVVYKVYFVTRKSIKIFRKCIFLKKSGVSEAEKTVGQTFRGTLRGSWD